MDLVKGAGVTRGDAGGAGRLRAMGGCDEGVVLDGGLEGGGAWGVDCWRDAG